MLPWIVGVTSAGLLDTAVYFRPLGGLRTSTLVTTSKLLGLASAGNPGSLAAKWPLALPLGPPASGIVLKFWLFVGPVSSVGVAEARASRTGESVSRLPE